MEVKKENNKNLYTLKAYHEKKEKEARTKNLEEDPFACFIEMSAETLFNFMNNKYDSIAFKSSDSLVKLNQAIIGRLVRFRVEFQAQQKRQFIEFVAKGGRNLTDEQYDSLINQTSYCLPRYSRAIKFAYKSIPLTEVVIHKNKTHLKESKIFYLSKFSQNCSKKFDYRKIKKEAIQFLKEFVEIVNAIKENQKTD